MPVEPNGMRPLNAVDLEGRSAHSTRADGGTGGTLEGDRHLTVGVAVEVLVVGCGRELDDAKG